MPGLGTAGRIAREGAHVAERAAGAGARAAVRAAEAPRDNRPQGWWREGLPAAQGEQAARRAPRASNLEHARQYNARRAGGTPGSRGEVAVPEPASVTERPAAPAPRRQASQAGPDGVMLWWYLRKYLSYYVHTSDDLLNVVIAWVLHAAARDRDDSGIGQLIWRASPRLLLTSYEPQSGKSTLLDLILFLLASRRGKIPKITAAKIAQVTGKYYETVGLDEARIIFGNGARQQELQGCLLTGYSQPASYEVAGKSLDLFGAVVYTAKMNLITEARGDAIGDLVTRTLIGILSAPDLPMPEVDEQAQADGAQLAQVIIAWTSSFRTELIQAAKDIAREDYLSARAAAEAAQAAGRKVAKENLRRIQITRPLRACVRVIEPAIDPETGEHRPHSVEAQVCASLQRLYGGASLAQAGDIMAGLQGRDWATGEPAAASEQEEGGRVVGHDPEDDWDDYGEEN